MASPARQPLSRRTHVYALTVATLGFLTVALSVIDLLRQPVGSHKDWLSLVAFTLISGWLSVKLPSVNASISISETFVFAGTLLYGPSVGVVLLVVDAAALCTKHAWVHGRLRWQQLLFNLSAPPLAIGCAAWLMGINGPIENFKLSFEFILLLGSFTAIYFLLSSWLVTLGRCIRGKSFAVADLVDKLYRALRQLCGRRIDCGVLGRECRRHRPNLHWCRVPAAAGYLLHVSVVPKACGS